MKKKLFGNNIPADCSYCKNMDPDSDAMNCIKNKEIINGRCKKFNYNPFLRVPKGKPKMMEFSMEDFVL